MDHKERREAPQQSRYTRLMKPWGRQVSTGGDRVEARALSEHTLVLEATAHYDGKQTQAAVPLDRESARALRDTLTAFLGE